MLKRFCIKDGLGPDGKPTFEIGVYTGRNTNSSEKETLAIFNKKFINAHNSLSSPIG